MSLITPYARDSQSYYDWSNILTSTVVSSLIAGVGTSFLILKSLGSQHPMRHYDGLLQIALNIATGFHSYESQNYINWLTAEPLRAIAIWGGATIAALSVGYMVFKATYVRIDADKHVSGRRLLEDKEAEADVKKQLKKAWKSGGGKGLQIHPSLILSRNQEVQSFLFMAAQGGGKTQVLWRLLNAAIKRKDKHNKGLGDKAIVFDLVKGDFTESIGKSPSGAGPVLISPWDARSAVWDIAADIRTLEDATSFAIGLIPLGKGEPIWANAARQILISLFMKLINEKDINWGWKELAELCYLPIEDLKEIAAQHYPPALASVLDAESKTTQSIYINMHAYLSVIYRLYLLWGDSKAKKFSFVKWLNNDNSKSRTIILQGNLKDEDLSSGYIRAITELLTCRIAALDFKQSKSRRIWFFMDEIKQAGKIECLARLMEYGRSKGICCVLAIQDISQIHQLYPLHEAQKWLALCSTKFYGQIRGGDSQKFVVEQVGTRIVDRFNQSVSRNTNSEERSVNSSYTRDSNAAVIHESELEQLGLTENNGGGIKALIIGIGTNALKIQWPFYSPPKLREPFVSKSINEVDAAPIIPTATQSPQVAVNNYEQSEEKEAENTEKDDSLNQFQTDEITIEEVIKEVTEEAVKSEISDEVSEFLVLNSGLVEVASIVLETENTEKDDSLNQSETSINQSETTVNINSKPTENQPKKRKKAIRYEYE